jgi:hypothetical protein
MADDKTAVQPIDMGGIKFSEIQANSWDDVLRTYQEWFSPKPESFKPNGPRPTQWLFRAERVGKPNQDDNKRRDCAGCNDTDASVCEASDPFFLTSLEKAFRAFGISDREEKRKWEEDVVREFKRKAHHFESGLPDAEDALEWLALIQHYSGPTRLLDCTYSFFVACYFAVNELHCTESAPCKSEKGQVWALDAAYVSFEDYKAEKPETERIANVVGSRDYQQCKEGPQQRACDRFPEECAPRNRVVDLLMKKHKACIYAVTPVRLNERLMNQRGVFLLQGDVTKCFVRNLRETIRAVNDDSASHLYRIVINLSLAEKKRCLWELDHMGINQAVLFPDLRGFAESLVRRMAFRDRRVPR